MSVLAGFGSVMLPDMPQEKGLPFPHLWDMSGPHRDEYGNV